MLRFSALLAAMLAMSCAHPRLSSPDGLALGTLHPLLQQRAPDFTRAKVARGAELDAKAFDGKVTIVHFWAAWSDASRETLPKLQALHARYKDRGVAVVALSVDDERAPIDELVASNGLEFPVAWDENKAVAGAWLVRSVPSSFVIDRNGVVRAAFVRYDDGSLVEIETDVKILASAGDANRAPFATR
jgi:peroxiredoxin